MRFPRPKNCAHPYIARIVEKTHAVFPFLEDDPIVQQEEPVSNGKGFFLVVGDINCRYFRFTQDAPQLAAELFPSACGPSAPRGSSSISRCGSGASARAQGDALLFHRRKSSVTLRPANGDMSIVSRAACTRFADLCFGSILHPQGRKRYSRRRCGGGKRGIILET